MSLADFERRMLRLKGIKLPSAELVESKHCSNGRPATVIKNKHQHRLLPEQGDEFVRDEDMDDILVGIVRSFAAGDSHKGMAMNVATIRSMLHKLPAISTQMIIDNYGYSKAQAKRYAQACRLVMMHKRRHDFNQLKHYAE